MDRLAFIDDLRLQGNHVESLRELWNLDHRLYPPRILMPVLPDLQKLIPLACQQFAQEAKLPERQPAVQWLENCLADWKPPAALIKRGDGDKLQDHRDRMIHVYFRCAKAAIDAGGPGTVIDRNTMKTLATDFDEPSGLLMDVTHAMIGLTGKPRAARTEQPVTPLLIDKTAGDVGVVARLKLELIPDGEGCLYRHPDMAFVWRDDFFRQAEKNALMAAFKDLGIAGRSVDFDIRWSMERVDRKLLHPVLTGDSAGLAFALGILRLLAGRPEVMSQAGGETKS